MVGSFVPNADGHDTEDLTFAATGWGAEAVSQIAGSFSEAAVEPPSSLPLLFWFFVNFTVIFPLLRDNPMIQYFQLAHERYRAV